MSVGRLSSRSINHNRQCSSISTRNKYPSDNFQMDSGSSSTENLIESLSNTLALLTKSYTSLFLKTNNQLRASSNAMGNKSLCSRREKLWFKMSVEDYNCGIINEGPISEKQLQEDGVDGIYWKKNSTLFLAGERLQTLMMMWMDHVKDLALNVGPCLEADECDAFDSDLTWVPLHRHVMTSHIDQYVEDNEDPCCSKKCIFCANDALMSILDEMHEQGVQSRLANKPDMVVNDSVTSELARYKELVGDHLKESVETVREIVEEARVVKPLDNSLNYACQYTKLSQELLEYVIGTCPKGFNTEKQAPYTLKADQSLEAYKENRILPAKKISVKFEKDHLCSLVTWESRCSPIGQNLKIQIWKVLHTLHMDLCGPMRVQSIKGKKYILVIVDDYSRFTWVKFLRSKDETPEFVTNFLKQIQVGLNKTVRFIRTDNGTEFVNQVIATYNDDILGKDPMFLWAEAVATALFGALCYPTNDSKDLGKFQAKADIGIFVGYAPSRKGYRIYNKRTHRLMETIHVTFDEMHQSMAPVRMSSGPEPFIMTPGQLKSGLAPTDKELEMLFQPMFDEHLEQSRVNEPVPSATEINAQVVPPGTSLSTTIAQDAPSSSASSSTSDMHHPVRHQEIAEEPTHEDPPINHDVLHPSHNLVTGDPGSAQSSSGNVNSAEPNQVNYPPDHLRRWTKDHPLDNIVGNPSRPVSTRKQLASDALWCCFHTELSKVEPKNFKMAVIEDCWFQAMQDEIHEFDRLEV
ncbi:putative ribonuclease H-like domain-containing protein [Tanacetum coccineum]